MKLDFQNNRKEKMGVEAIFEEKMAKNFSK